MAYWYRQRQRGRGKGRDVEANLKGGLLLLIAGTVPCSRACTDPAQAGQLLLQLLVMLSWLRHKVTVRVLLRSRGIVVPCSVMRSRAWLGCRLRDQRGVCWVLNRTVACGRPVAGT